MAVLAERRAVQDQPPVTVRSLRSIDRAGPAPSSRDSSPVAVADFHTDAPTARRLVQPSPADYLPALPAPVTAPPSGTVIIYMMRFAPVPCVWPQHMARIV